MPLSHGKSPRSFSKNVSTEMHEGKPLKQSLAIAYAMKKRRHKMASGGMCQHGKSSCEMCHGGEYAKGGMARENHHEKGVHQPMFEHYDAPHGSSQAGYAVREAQQLRENPDDEENEGDNENQAQFNEESAKHMHRQKLAELKSMKKPHLYAKGGMVEEEEQSGYMSHPEEPMKMDHKAMMESDRMLNQHGMDEMAADDMEEDNEPQHERMVSHPVENQDDHEDMVGRIMKQRQKHYSEGGRVANETSKSAEFEPNQFDDLVNRDDLEEHYTGKNSGDELGNAREDEDRADIVARIMKQRRMKDRNPHPA